MYSVLITTETVWLLASTIHECIFSDDVKRFHLKHHEDNAFVLLFMKVVILQQKSKFGYLYKFNAERMANTRIMLPVTDDGAPDYEYMEQYAKKSDAPEV